MISRLALLQRAAQLTSGMELNLRLPVRPLLLALLYAILAIILLHRSLLGDGTFFGCCDASIQTVAWINKVAQAVRSGTLPLWDFSTYAGSSFAGEIQPAPFYPITWGLALLFHDPLGLPTAFVFLHFLIAAFSMHLLLQELKLGFVPALLGAMTFAFTSYVAPRAAGQANIHAGQVWLPLVFLFYYRAFSHADPKYRLRSITLAGLVGALQITAGHLQPFIHTSYAIGIFAIVAGMSRGLKGLAQTVPLLIAGQIISIAIAAVPLALANEYLHLVYRWYGEGVSTFPHKLPFEHYATGGNLEWSELRLLFSPAGALGADGCTLYFTITGLCCALLAPFTPGRTVVLYALVLAGFAVLVALGGNVPPVAHLSYHLPLLAQVRTPVRALYLFAFAAALLSAAGASLACAWAARRHTLAGRVLAGALLVAVTAEAWVFAGRQIGMPTTHAQYAPRYYFENPALAALVNLSYQWPRVYRFIAEPRDLVPPNAGNLVPVLNVLGHRGTMLQSLNDYIAQDWSMSSPYFDRLGVRWIIAATPVQGFPTVAQGPGYVIQERPNALPVFWLYDTDTDSRSAAPIERVEWAPNRVRVHLGAHAGGRLVFAQPFYPGWTATVDERSLPVSQHEIFLSIEVPEGRQHVTFSYTPSIGPWLAITALALATLGSAAFWSRRSPPAGSCTVESPGAYSP